MSENEKAPTIYEQACAVVGEEAVESLRAAGFLVVDAEALERFQAEHRASNQRLRDTAAATMKAAGLMTTRCEILVVDGMPTIIVTHPAGDEVAMAKAIVKRLAAVWEDDRSSEIKTASMIDAEEIRDTNDVSIAAEKPSEG